MKPSTIVSAFYGLWDPRKELKIQVELWEELRNVDTIYIVPLAGHVFVVLHYASKKIGYVADGANMFADDEAIRKDLNKHLGNKLILLPRNYNSQTGVDHCGSSAVLIALETAKHYHTDTRPKMLIPEKRLLERVTRWYHPGQSEPTPNKRPEDYRIPLKCEICKKAFPFGATKEFKRHVLMHQ